MKTLTRKQLQSRKAQAVRFARDVREDDDLADEIEHQSLDEYAERRHIKLTNPKGARKMAIKTRRELLDRIAELQDENEELREKVDSIAEIVGEEDEGEDDDQGE
jgi:hypothetical protein